MSTAAVKRDTVDEYLAQQQVSGVKHEFFGGEMFAMAGGAWPYNMVSLNVAVELRPAPEDSPCQGAGGRGQAPFREFDRHGACCLSRTKWRLNPL
ncbi:MAG: hypothetical protein AB7U20_05450 [Planctomycetaceae bacterium]